MENKLPKIKTQQRHSIKDCFLFIISFGKTFKNKVINIIFFAKFANFVSTNHISTNLHRKKEFIDLIFLGGITVSALYVTFPSM